MAGIAVQNNGDFFDVFHIHSAFSIFDEINEMLRCSLI